MPLRIYVNGQKTDIKPSARFVTMDLGVGNPSVTTDINYYVATLEMTAD